MAETNKQFLAQSAKKAFDLNHRKIINFNISKYEKAFKSGLNVYSDLSLAKKRASRQKNQAINNLDKYLIEFEYNISKNGGQVLWALDDKTARKQILDICKKENISMVVKSKSMTTEEIDLNKHLEKANIEAVETDLGEFIVQLLDEKPYHIVTPAMHKSKEDVAELFHEKFNTAKDASPQELTRYTRGKLREKFLNAGAGITGANFLISDTGSIAITENEGNAIISMSYPKVHIVLAGIEKIIPSIKDLDTFWPLLATHGTGQHMTVYNSIISGPRKNNEESGPEKLYIILIDNGRSELLSKPKQRQALECIRCGACLNFCPVYKNIGGHTYNASYSGPIGSVISPHYQGMEDFKHLSYASSLCGRCTEVCPVNIDIHKLLLLNRKEAVDSGFVKGSEKRTMALYTRVMSKRRLLDLTGSGMKNMAMKIALRKSWAKHRQLPHFAPKSFNKLWKENHPEIKKKKQ